MTQFMADLLTTQQHIVDIHHQEFSLWIRHKLNFVSPNDKLVRQIKLSLDNLKLALDHLYHYPNTDREKTI